MAANEEETVLPDDTISIDEVEVPAPAEEEVDDSAATFSDGPVTYDQAVNDDYRAFGLDNSIRYSNSNAREVDNTDYGTDYGSEDYPF